MTRILFIRHGRTVSNNARRYSGHNDVELDAVGLEQARKVAARLKDQPLTAVYASDLQRAFLTAEEIAKEHGLEVIRLPELRELNFGVWEGKTHQEIVEEDNELVQKWFNDPFTVLIPEGETMADLQLRIVKCIKQIVKDHPDETVAVVSHAGPIWVMLSYILAIPPQSSWKIKIENTSITIIEFYENDSGYICTVNDAYHMHN